MIILVLLLALVLRLICLNQSLWLDEAVQAITAQGSLAYIFQEIRGDFHPPLYFFLMHFWVRIFGSSEVALRMPSVLFGVGTIFIFYKLTMHVHGRFVATLSALFLATSQFHVYYSQEARMYSMATFFATLSMFYFIKILNIKLQISNPNLKFQIFNKNYFLYLFSTLCLIYTDYYGFLVVLAQGIYLLTKRKYKFLILNTCFLILCFLPWLPMLITQIKVGAAATQLLPGWGKLVNVSFLKAIPLTLVKFSIGRMTIFNKTIYWLVIAVILGLLGVLGYHFFNTKEGVRNYKSIMILWFVVPLVVSWVVSLFIPNFQPFRLLLILPAFYLILAGGTEGLANDGKTKWILMGIILLINFISLGIYYSDCYFQREDWRGVANFLKTEDALAVLPSETSSWPIKYYDPTNSINFRSMAEGIGRVKGVGDIDEQKVFYVRYLVDLFDPNELILAELNSKGYTKVREISFNQIPVWEFNKR